MTMKTEDAWRRLTVQENVIDELLAQDDKWGQQDHQDVCDGVTDPDSERDFYRIRSEAWKALNADRVEEEVLSWDGILLEEVYEALSEADPGRLYDELIQVAAVAQQWAECILRRGDRGV